LRKRMGSGVHAEVDEEMVDIGPIGREVAKALLRRACGREAEACDDRLLERLVVEVCKCNALSMVMIGGFIRCKRSTVEVRDGGGPAWSGCCHVRYVCCGPYGVGGRQQGYDWCMLVCVLRRWGGQAITSVAVSTSRRLRGMHVHVDHMLNRSRQLSRLS
jgi:hypothetical protein